MEDVQHRLGPRLFVGLIFQPTDVELLDFYLKRKIASKELGHDLISEVNLQDYHPSQLIEAYKEKGDQEKEWYFFSPRKRKYQKGKRPDRMVKGGFWRATGGDEIIRETNKGVNRVVGIKKDLVFYEGSNSKGAKKTNWLMKEYRIDDHQKAINNGDDCMKLDDWVLCKIYENKNRSRGRRKKRVCLVDRPIVHCKNSYRESTGQGSTTNEALGFAYEGDDIPASHTTMMKNGSDFKQQGATDEVLGFTYEGDIPASHTTMTRNGSDVEQQGATNEAFGFVYEGEIPASHTATMIKNCSDVEQWNITDEDLDLVVNEILSTEGGLHIDFDAMIENENSDVPRDPSSSSDNNSRGSVLSSIPAKYEDIIAIRRNGSENSFSAPGSTSMEIPQQLPMDPLFSNNNSFDGYLASNGTLMDFDLSRMIEPPLLSDHCGLSRFNENPSTSYASPSNVAPPILRGSHEISMPTENPSTSYASPSNVASQLLTAPYELSRPNKYPRTSYETYLFHNSNDPNMEFYGFVD